MKKKVGDIATVIIGKKSIQGKITEIDDEGKVTLDQFWPGSKIVYAYGLPK